MYFRPPPKGPEWYAGDAETGQAARLLYPLMLEDPRLRWAFIRKVYSILSIQMLLTVAVAVVSPSPRSLPQRQRRLAACLPPIPSPTLPPPPTFASLRVTCCKHSHCCCLLPSLHREIDR